MISSFDSQVRFKKPVVSQINLPQSANEAREFALNPYISRTRDSSMEHKFGSA